MARLALERREQNPMEAENPSIGVPVMHPDVPPAVTGNRKLVPPEERRCRARHRDGGRCKNWAIRGGTVCRYHGGSAPQVRAAAAERLAALVHPAITRLSRLMRNRNPHIRMRAVENILDRTNFKGDTVIRLTGGDGGPVETADLTTRVRSLSTEELAAVERALSLLGISLSADIAKPQVIDVTPSPAPLSD